MGTNPMLIVKKKVALKRAFWMNELEKSKEKESESKTEIERVREIDIDREREREMYGIILSG